VCQTTENTN